MKLVLGGAVSVVGYFRQLGIKMNYSSNDANQRALSMSFEPLSVSVPTAAELLGFKDIKSVYKLIGQGKIKARKSGRIYLVNYASLKKYVEG